MAEIVGLVLGGIPLVISAVEIFAAPIEAYMDYHDQVLLFRSLLSIQKRSLEITLRDIGLEYSEQMTKNELRDCIQSKYPSVAGDILHIYECIEKEMIKMMRKLGVDHHTQVRYVVTMSKLYYEK